MARRWAGWPVLAATMVAAAGCQGGPGDNYGTLLGLDGFPGNPAGIPSGFRWIGGPTFFTGDPSARVGPTCATPDCGHLCLALRYIVYNDGSGNPVASARNAVDNLAEVNALWSACNLGFQIEEYAAVNPADYGLTYQPAETAELDGVRQVFDNHRALLLVTTGTWNRSGTLGDSSANAWTRLPGDGLQGAVLERPVALYPNLIAHELGHYLNLLHVDDRANVMDPLVYQGSTALNADQCLAARAAAEYFWPVMLR